MNSLGQSTVIFFIRCELMEPTKGQVMKSHIKIMATALISGLLGARLFYIILNFDFFSQNPSEILMIQNGGLAVQGAMLGGFLAALIYIKRKKLPLLIMVDLSVAYAALGQSIGRMGCFLNGCCYGKPVSWGIYFPVHGDHLHPTQIYLVVGNLLIFFILRSFYKKNHVQGQTLCLYVGLASLLRFCVEFYRADHYQTFVGLSVYQWVALGFVLAAVSFSRKLKL